MTIIKMVSKVLSIILLCLSATLTFAQQNFKFKARLQKADSSGFYKIELSPDVLAKSNADLSDIRLITDAKHFQPFIYGGLLHNKAVTKFIPFVQVALKQTDSITNLVIQNQPNLAINQLSLRMRNTQAERVYTLSGSDDLNSWYAIKENVILHGNSSQSNTSDFEQVVNFPTSNYRFFKFAVNNNKSEPVKFLQVGIYKNQAVKSVFSTLAGITFSQKDTGSVTKLTVNLKDTYPVNKLRIKIAGTALYRRNISVYAIAGKQQNWLTDTIISSGTANEINLSAKTKQIQIDISNGDNPPLKIDSVEACYLNQFIVANLIKDKAYALMFGDSKAKSPNYDLAFFADSVKSILTTVGVSAVSANEDLSKINKIDKSYPAWLMWLAIILAIAVLGFLTLKMTKEIGKKENDGN